jgi:glycosyltransferase involved in cell wall biosynthesis
MEIYWYWPFAREEDVAVVPATVREGDHLTVHTLRRPGSPEPISEAGYSFVPTLPEVRERDEGTARWLASRATTYTARARQRRRTLRQGRFDLCHIHYLNRFTDTVDLRLLRRRLPVVADVHDVLPHQSRLPGDAEARILKPLYSAPDLLIAHHESVADALVARFAIPRRNIRLVPLVVRDVGGQVQQLSARPEVLFFGTFRRNKGIEVLLSAIAEMRDMCDLTFRFAGRGFSDQEQMVRAAARQDRRIVPEIEWITPARKDELYRSSALVAMPYTSFASQSGVLHDAYAHRRPVVVSDVGALGDSVRMDQTGWVVPPSRPEALAAAIREALASPSLYARAAEGTARAAERQSPIRVGQALRNIYDEVMVTRGR